MKKRLLPILGMVCMLTAAITLGAALSYQHTCEGEVDGKCSASKLYHPMKDSLAYKETSIRVSAGNAGVQRGWNESVIESTLHVLISAR